jgi:DNA-directed RNA polymerase specialized sigma24 family protein
MPPEVLGKMIDTLHGLQMEKIERHRKLVSMTHSLYYRCLSYERQLVNKIENTPTSDLLSRRLARSRQRLVNVRKRLKSMRIEATNSDLAKLLGIPKGTVDSRLAAIKNKLSVNELDF